jgi:phospholipase/carboxylesterase
LQPLGLGGSRDAQLYVPKGHVVGEPLPLLVVLHGAGARASAWFGSYGARAEAARMIVLAPDSRRTTWDLMSGQFGLDIDFITEALDATFSMCSVDPGRIAVGGFSDGASYALSLGIANGDFFNRIVAFSPGVLAIAEQVGRPSIFVSHATDDSVLPIRATRGFVAALRKQGYPTEFLEFTGGHAVPASVSDAAFRWLASAAASNPAADTLRVTPYSNSGE